MALPTLIDCSSFEYFTSVATFFTNVVHGTGYTIVTTPVTGIHKQSLNAVCSSASWNGRNLPAGQTHILLGVRFKAAGFGGPGRTNLLEVYNQAGAGPIFECGWTNSAAPVTLNMRVNGAAQGATASFSDTASWHTVWFECSIAVAGKANFWLDNVLIATYAGNTSGLGTSFGFFGMGVLELAGGTAGTINFTDYSCYALNGTEALPPPDTTTDGLLPNADGTFVQWSHTGANSFGQVSEVPADDDTTYISNLDAGHNPTKTTLAHAALGGTRDLAGVNYVVRARNTAGAPTFQPAYYDQGTATTTLGGALTPAAGYTYQYALTTVDPRTGVAWLQADFNILETGVQAANGNDVRVTQLCLEVVHYATQSRNLGPTSIATAEALGTPTVDPRYLGVASIATAEAFQVPLVRTARPDQGGTGTDPVWQGEQLLGGSSAAPVIPFDLFQIVSDFHAATNQRVYAYRLTGPAGALGVQTIYGPYALPNEPVYCVASRTARYLWFGTRNAGLGTSKIYRMDVLDGTLTVMYQEDGSGAVPWRIYWYDDDTVYVVFARGSGAHVVSSTDRGQTWQSLVGSFNVDENNDNFVELPAQAYDIVRIGGTLYTTHTAQTTDINNPNAPRWGVSSSGDNGATWAPIIGTSAQFLKGARGMIAAVGLHLPYIGEGFISFVGGDASLPSEGDTGGGNDASDQWSLAFANGTVLFRGSVGTRISLNYGTNWGAAVAAPPTGEVSDTIHKPNVRRSDDYAIVNNWGAQTLNITTDHGTTWQAIPVPSWCRLGCFVGGM